MPDWESGFMKLLSRFKQSRDWRFFLKYVALFMLLFISLAMSALFVLLREQSRPFFYSMF
jgi:hypothetical protein